LGFAGKSFTLFAFQSDHPSWYEAPKYSNWCWICCQGWFNC